MILTKETINAYNRSRNCVNDSIVCHAPVTNLNFEQTGDVRACCYNYKHVLGKWPQQSIKQIWTGEKVKALRGFVAANDLGGGCIECGKMIENGNYQGVRAKYYDEFATGFLRQKIADVKNSFTGAITYPKVMEFELSNTCNLECVMCNGSFSSSIRKNREKLPPIISPYNEKFVDELEEFIPHLTDAKFLGGEPFMIDIYLSIWERILKINPNVRIHITTNGTFLNNRIKDLLAGLKAGIILSIDSVVKDTYSKIRVNGNYEKVMENLTYFIEYTRQKKTFISMAACPITYNWKELPGMLEFCLERDITLYFNVVFTPFSLSLRELPVEELKEVIAYLENYQLPELKGGADSPRNLSIKAYVDYINLLKGWLQEKQAPAKPVVMEELAGQHAEVVPAESIEQLEIEIAKTVTRQLELEAGGFTEDQRVLQNRLSELLLSTPKGDVVRSLQCVVKTVDNYQGRVTEVASLTKLEKIASLIEGHEHRNNVLRTMAQGQPSVLTSFINQMELSQLQEYFNAQFNGQV
ncbi:MAG TPA: twitch domain-containing radical SAM protein [Chitinophagales bacterium]|nr:twitch domain-containing radical SAM protein [Chitinophagales bacterium]